MAHLQRASNKNVTIMVQKNSIQMLNELQFKNTYISNLAPV